MDGVKEGAMEEAEAAAKAAGESRAAHLKLESGDGVKLLDAADGALSSGDESGGDVSMDDACSESVSVVSRRKSRKKEDKDTESKAGANAGGGDEGEEEEEDAEKTLDAKTVEFWKFFKEKVSEWNPCHLDDDGYVRFRWDEEVGAHDVEVDMGADADQTDMTCQVCLESYCPDVSSTPHIVRLGSLLERLLLDRSSGEPWRRWA